MIRTSEEQKLTRSVFASVALLRQYPGPSTNRRYAEIPNLGLFEWSYGSEVADDGATSIVPSSGALGSWLLTQPAANYSTSVRLVATSPVTLSGSQTVDGVATAAGNRVLLTAQASAVANGVYVASAGAWQRAGDWADGDSVALGTTVVVLAGTEGGKLWYMSSPTSGTVIVGASSLTFSRLSGGVSDVDFNALEARVDVAEADILDLQYNSIAAPTSLTLDSNQSIDASGVGGTLGTALSLVRAASGHVPNTETTVFVGAYTRSAIYLASDLNVIGADGGAFSYDPDLDCVIRLRQITSTRTVGLAYQLERSDVTAPELMLCVCPTATTDTIELWFTKAVRFVSLANISLSGTMAVARTITSIKSGNGTTRVILQLSGALADGDTVNVVFGASHTVSDLNSLALRAQTIAVFWYAHPTELAGFTLYRDAQVAIDVASGQWPAPEDSNGDAVDAVVVQQVTAALQPVTTANRYEGATSLLCAPVSVTADNVTNTFTCAAGWSVPDGSPVMFHFDPGGSSPGSMATGITDGGTYYAINGNSSTKTFQVEATLGGGVVNFSSNGSKLYCYYRLASSVAQMSALITNSANTCWVACRANKIPFTDGAGGAYYLRECVLGANQSWAVTVDKGLGADSCVAGAFLLDGGYQNVDTPIEEATPFLARHRHVGGQMEVRRDRRTPPASVLAGNVSPLTAPLVVGAKATDTKHVDSDIFAIVMTNAVQTDRMIEGAESFFTLQPWGGFLRHDMLYPPPKLGAVVGQPSYLHWSQIHLTAGGVGQYVYAVSGGGVADADKWSWTPAIGDIGEHTVTITVTLGGRPVAVRSFVVEVMAAATTGTLRVLALGDSWTDAFLFVEQMRSRLASDGLTVTMMGSRGGRTVTVNSTNNVWSSTGHGYANNEPVTLLHNLTTGALPTAVLGDLEEGITYYVEAIDAFTFGLRRIVDGARIDVTNTGTGQLKIRNANERNEGRAGWGWDNFYYGNHSTEGTGPFIDPNTGEFSWAYYKTNQLSGIDPDVIVHQLGVNNLATGGNYAPTGNTYSVDYDDPDSVAFALDYACGIAERIFRSISAASPTVKHLLMLPGGPSTRQSDARTTYGYTGITADGWRRTQQKLVNRYIEQFGGREGEGIYLLSAQVYDRTAGFTAPDFFHPNEADGYDHVGNQAAARIRTII